MQKIFSVNFKKVPTFLTLLFFILSTGRPLPAFASVPAVMSYQGILKDGSGNYLTGTYSMVFRIYSASTGGTALWTETQSSVSVSSGKFNVLLGSVTTLGLDFDTDYWLSVQVGADSEMTPRVRLTSAGYAYQAKNVTDGFTQSQHDAMSHKNIEGVKDNTVLIGKSNFKLDAYSTAAANSLGDMILDTFNDASGISTGSSSGYSWRGSSNFDVVASQGGIDSNVVLMLHSNGTDASTTFTDSSSGSKTVTANGNAQVDTAQSKFGSASALFDGSGDYLTAADSNDWNFGTGNFTIDFWIRFNAITAEDGLIAISNTSSAQDINNLFTLRISGTNSSNLQFLVKSGGSTLIDQSAAHGFSTGNWYHVALIRGWGGNANDWAVTVNGTTIMSFTNSSTMPDFTSNLRIGDDPYSGNSPLNGWMDEIRISKSTARWTASFTAPSAEYASGGGSATVISNAYAESTAPSEAIVIADETLNTGSITYSVSRDNGTTWTTCTKETMCSISAQPSGTQVKWKAVITGDAELNAIAIAV